MAGSKWNELWSIWNEFARSNAEWVHSCSSRLSTFVFADDDDTDKLSGWIFSSTSSQLLDKSDNLVYSSKRFKDSLVTMTAKICTEPPNPVNNNYCKINKKQNTSFHLENYFLPRTIYVLFLLTPLKVSFLFSKYSLPPSDTHTHTLTHSLSLSLLPTLECVINLFKAMRSTTLLIPMVSIVH